MGISALRTLRNTLSCLVVREGRPVRKFELVLIIHAHQPVGNFDDVFERSYQQAYLPFVEVLQRHPAIRLGLHYSGPLLEWIERAHPEYFERLRGLVEKKQVEMLGGGFYEPILAVIPPQDCHEQITRLADYVERHFGAQARRRMACGTSVGAATSLLARARGRCVHFGR